jgi:hypothetical protein
VTTGPSNLYDMAHTILDAVSAQMAADGVDVPDRQYVTMGVPVAECGALVVAWERLGRGTASGTGEVVRPVDFAATRVATFSVWLLRCLSATVPDEGVDLAAAPTVAELEADAEVVLTDAYVVERGLGRARQAAQVRERGVQMQAYPVVPMEPSGGIGGVRCLVRVDLW